MTAALYIDPFAEEQERPPRDRYDRPLLVPKGGGERIAYTRASTLANYLTDSTALEVWQKQKLAIGLARRPDLVAMIAALPLIHDEEADKSSLSKQQLAEDKATKKLLNGYINEALEAGGCHFKANHGTAVHGFTDGTPTLGPVPQRMAADVDSFMTYVGSGKLEIYATEVTVVNDNLMCAGKFDHLAILDGVPGMSMPVVVDKKTGSVQGKGLAFAVQLATYATSEVYDLDTDERRPLESLTGGQRVSRQWGVVAHIPLGAARTDFYRIDLARGVHCARLAANVRQARQLDGLCTRLEF